MFDCIIVHRVRSIYENYCDPSITAATIAANPPSVSSTAFTYYFYLYPFEYIESPGSTTYTTQLKASDYTYILPLFNTGFSSASISAIQSFAYGGVVSIYAPSFTSTGTISSTSTSILLSGISL